MALPFSDHDRTKTASFDEIKKAFDALVLAANKVISEPQSRSLTDLSSEERAKKVGFIEKIRRFFSFLFGKKKNPVSYDTDENRLVRFLLDRTSYDLSEYGAFVWQKTSDEALNDETKAVEKMRETVGSLIRDSFLSSVPSGQNDLLYCENVLSPAYFELKERCLVFHRLLSERRETEEMKTADAGADTVLVGSLRNEEQYRINFEDKFYYAPLSVLRRDKFPIHYVALYRPKYWKDPGIRCFGKVKTTTRVKRKEIPVPMRQGCTGEEPYCLFTIEEWKFLKEPIKVKEEGVYEPKYTSLFLLKHCKQTFELFNVKNKGQYDLLCALHELTELKDGEALIPINETRYVKTKDAAFSLCGKDGEILERIEFSDYERHPKQYFLKLAEYFKDG